MLEADWKFTNPKVFGKTKLKKLTQWNQVYKGTHVAVFEETNESKYMLKILDKKFRIQFWTEIKYGQIPGIEKSGVRVHAHAILENGSGVYIMDHASMGDPNVSATMTVDMYSKKPFFNAVKLNTMLKSTLLTFYRTVKGFHGDLHDGNVMVNLDKKNKLLSVKIIDYANITPFTRSKRMPRSFDHVMSKIKKEFNRLKFTELNEYPEGSGIQVKWQGDIPVRSNQVMLTQLHPWKNIMHY